MKSPAALGLDATRFPDWRPGQPEAIARALSGGPEARRVSALVMPTGFGKSLVYIALALLSGWRTVVLTSTKALQRQLARDLGDLMTLVQGQREYRCEAVQPGGELETIFRGDLPCRVDHAPCHAGHTCTLRTGGCAYYDTVREAQDARLVITNYAWWHTLPFFKIAELHPELLVLDEAHAAPDALASAVGARLILSEARTYLGPRVDALVGRDAARWVAWAKEHVGPLAVRIERAQSSRAEEGRTVRRMMNLHTEIRKLTRLRPELMVISEEDDGGVQRFDAIWSASHAEPVTFRGVRRVVLTSATLTPKTIDLLGLPSKHVDFYAAGDGFPVDRRRVWICPATDAYGDPVRVDYRMGHIRQRDWVEHIDRYLDQRTDRKGILHTVSYKRADLFLTQSRHRGRMMSHTSRDTGAQVERFKRARPGTIFVSPAVTTGYDFPGDECEFQVLTKVPFPDSSDPITKARTIVDKEYPAHLAMQQIVQMTGRGMRAETDRCETLIPDAHAFWFFNKNKHLAPAWFMRAVRRTQSLPPVPPRVEPTS